jgi:hypothetical protein
MPTTIAKDQKRSLTLLPDQLAELLDDLALRPRPEEEPGQPHDDDEAGREGEDRVVGEGGAHALRPVLVPVAEGVAQQ